MYTKVFRSIFDGSLYGKFEATIVFLAMLVLADKDGTVDMTAEKIAAECGYPLDIVQRGITELEKPDPRSRTPDEDGRRITTLHDAGWGWHIVNYAKYREIRSADERREYFRIKKQEQRAAKKDCPQCPPVSTARHLSEAEAEAEAESRNKIGAPRRAMKVDPEGFAAIQKSYPRRGGGQRWDDARKGYMRSVAAGASPDEILAGVERYAHHIRADGKEGTPYVQQAATFLGANESWREAWEPVKQQKILSAVDRVNLAYEAQNDRVVSEQNKQGFGDMEILGTDVRNPVRTGLRRIGS